MEPTEAAYRHLLGTFHEVLYDNPATVVGDRVTAIVKAGVVLEGKTGVGVLLSEYTHIDGETQRPPHTDRGNRIDNTLYELVNEPDQAAWEPDEGMKFLELAELLQRTIFTEWTTQHMAEEVREELAEPEVGND
jgi:hypothetical protein